MDKEKLVKLAQDQVKYLFLKSWKSVDYWNSLYTQNSLTVEELDWIQNNLTVDFIVSIK